MNSMFFEDLNLMFIGQTGSGKTTLCRTLLNFDLKEYTSLNSDTVKTYLTRKYDEKKNRYVKVIDTIGFSDLNKSDREIFFETKEFCQNCDISYINEIIVVIKADRFSKQEESSIIYFLERLHNKAKHNTSICFTHCLQKNINFDQFYIDLKSREIIKFIGRNIYFTDIDDFRHYKTNGTLEMILISARNLEHIHFNKLFNGPLMQKHKFDTEIPKIMKPIDVLVIKNDDKI